MLDAWKLRTDGSYEDPALGSVTSSVSITAVDTEVADTAALGKPERVNLVPDVVVICKNSFCVCPRYSNS